MSITVNHVMSQDIASGIFADILAYFEQYAPRGIKHVASVSPIEGADVYHYHRPQLEKALKPASVCTVHHDLNDTDPWVALSKFMPRYRESAAIICLNTLQRDILANEGIAPERLFVVPHGYNTRILTPKPERTFDAERKLTIGFVSKRYGRRVKGEAYLYELAKRMDADRFAFLLVGGSRMTDAAALRSLGFECRVYERLPYRVFNDVYRNMDFLLMASQFEGGPANIPEAVATGTPVLTNPIGMAFDAVENGVNGVHLTMNPSIDAELLAQLAANHGGVTDRLYAGAAKNIGNAITWRESMEKNMEVQSLVAERHRPMPLDVTASK